MRAQARRLRALARIPDGRVELLSRNAPTARFGLSRGREFTAGTRTGTATSAHAPADRNHTSRAEAAAVLCCFDLRAVDRADLRGQPLINRKALLFEGRVADARYVSSHARWVSTGQPLGPEQK